jgi:hypothetical protein
VLSQGSKIGILKVVRRFDVKNGQIAVQHLSKREEAGLTL